MPTARKRLLIAAGVAAGLGVAAAVGALVAGGGGMPLEDGYTLADGAVQCAVDSYVSACLLPIGGGQVALVDANMDPEAVALRGLLARRGYGVEDVAAIFITHGHHDHIGGIGAFPGAEVFVLEADADLVEGRRAADNLLGRFQGAAATGFVVARGLVDGEVVRMGSLTLEVFAIPGHTRGSAAFLARGVLFLGDSAAAAADGTMRAAPPIFSADRPRNHQSLVALAERLRGREVSISAMAFSHQGPLVGLGPLLGWAEAR